MSGNRTGVHLVSYSRTRDTSAADLADAFASMLDRASRELAWADQALCAETDPEAFYPEKGSSTREAKRTCMACEVRSECLEYALARDERFGVWGGLSERQRRALRRKRDQAGGVAA
jgi:WhiB family transcriptional regulator, redox-sensing transcriptional regulator